MPRHVIARGAWATNAATRPHVARGGLRAVVVHHTGRACPVGTDASLAEEVALCRAVHAAHQRRGFIDIGYHYLVMPSGRAFEGRPTEALGAHVRGFNRGTIGLCLAGDFDVEQPTPAALATLEALVGGLAGGVPVLGHSALAPKRCPGRALERHLPSGALAHAA
jgi:N-acetylmuramoyl-L-alanine amidase